MITFKNYLLEGLQIADLRKRYDKFNMKLFSNELPSSDELGWKVSKKLKKATALTKAKYSGMKLISMAIEFSDRLALPDEEINKILIHEMIHVYFLRTKDNENHGPRFKKMAVELGSKVGLVIPITHDTSDFGINPDIKSKERYFIMKEEFDGSFSVGTYTLKSVDVYGGIVSVSDMIKRVINYNSSRIKKMWLLKSAHSIGERFAVKRKITKTLEFYHIKSELAADIINSSETIFETK